MIRLPDMPLSPSALRQLERWQAEVDAAEGHPRRVQVAKQRFKRYNRRGNATFDEVRRTLTAMCAGASRCGYCEDSAADEVEHIWPKDLYPELVFAWLNYLYACGSCNRSKSNRFALFLRSGRKPVEVRRRRGETGPPP